MSDYFRFAKNIGIVGLTNFLIVLERIILLPIITKLLGPANYGIWTQLGITLSLISPLILLGLPLALVRFLSGNQNKEEIREGFSSVLFLVFILGAIAALILKFFSQPISEFLDIPQNLIQILSLIILLECLISVLFAFFQVFQEIGKYAFFFLFKIFGELGLVVSAVFLGYGLLGAVLALFAIRLITFFILLAFLFKKIGVKIPAFLKIREYLNFSLPTLLSSVSYWVVTSSDRYLIGFFLGVLFVGYYSPAYTLGNLLTFFIYPLAFMMPIALSSLFDQKQIEEVKIYLEYCLKYFLMAAIPSAFGLSVLSYQLLAIFSTKEIAFNSYYITPFATLSILLYGITAFFNQVLILTKKTKISGAIWLISALLNIGLNFILIPIFGIIAAALTTLFSYFLSFGLIWYFSAREFQFKIDWRFILKSVFASSLMSLFIVWFNPAGLSKTILAIVLGAVIYGLLIILSRGFNKRELEFIKIFKFKKV